MVEISRLQDFPFAQSELRDAALTHRSAGNQHNERLEFLGDAVLNFVIAEALYQALPKADEGALTRLRAHLVRGETLAEIAREMQLGMVIELGQGELRSGGHQRASIQADAFEALLGAIFLDSGFATVREQILQIYAGRLAALPDAETLKDPKTRLQELLQSQGCELPRYDVINESGPQHRKTFVVECRTSDVQVVGRGGSRRQAEQAAARKLFEQLSK